MKRKKKEGKFLIPFVHIGGKGGTSGDKSMIMPMLRIAGFFLLLFLLSCESSHDKISRLQSELLTALGERDSFEIVSNKQKICLPLPPAPELAASRTSKIAAINLETYSFENERLSQEDQARLTQLSHHVNDMVKRGNNAFFDPTKCVLTEKLRVNTLQADRGLTSVLLQKIPDYYAEVERRWQTPDITQARRAAEQSVLVLDWLEKMDGNTNPARLAVKDFICLCHSAVLTD